jgi:hypothetical protein
MRQQPRLIRHFGQRALWIWLFAGIGLCTAITLIFMEPNRIPDLVHTHLPQWFRATLWGITALVAAPLARMWGGRYQWIAFLILGIAPSERLASFAISVILNLVDYSPLFWQRLGGFLAYVLWIGALWLASMSIDPVDMDALADKVAAPPIAKGA